MTSQSEGQRQERTGSSAKLPAATLADVLPIARALHELAGPASKELIAEHASMSPAGGAFKTKFATAQYYALLERQQGAYVLTPLGEAVVAEDENISGRARQKAVMASGFGPLLARIHRFGW